MIGEYKDLNADSGIADLPSTLNYNNSVSRKAFDSIFDSDKGVLVKSVENKNGHIKMHHADFVNLTVDNLIVRNSRTDDSEVEFDKHEDLINRFSWNFSSAPTISISEIEKFAHDTKMIVSAADSSNPIIVGESSFETPVTLRNELDAIEKLLNGIAKNLTFKTGDDSISEDTEFFAASSDSVENNDEDIDEDIRTRLTNIEKRLTNIEYRLDTL